MSIGPEHDVTLDAALVGGDATFPSPPRTRAPAAAELLWCTTWTGPVARSP